MDAVEAAQFEAERERLTRLASRILKDPDEAQDVVQQAWLRTQRVDTAIDNLPAWLTTATTRLCLDRLKSRVPLPVDRADAPETPAPQADPAEELALADSLGTALHAVLDRLTPAERVAFVMHDSFDFDFALIAAALDVSPAAARKLASRARAKLRRSAPVGTLTDWEIVDAFLTAARGGDFDRLLELLAPEAVVTADAAAIVAGTPQRIEGGRRIAEFFNGAASAALLVETDGRSGAAWFLRGEAKVVFDFAIAGGVVQGITFRADPGVLARVVRS